MAKELNKTTSICGYDADNIMVRGKNLVTELMGKVSFPEMILLQMLGKAPTAAQVEILNAVMVTIMEHGLVPSAIAARLTIYGAPESYQGAIAAGLLGVGDRFAGTASACAKMLEPLVAVPEAEREAACRAALREMKATKQPVPGFGHPIHRDGDPRYARLMDITRNAGTSGAYLKTLELLEFLHRGGNRPSIGDQYLGRHRRGAWRGGAARQGHAGHRIDCSLRRPCGASPRGIGTPDRRSHVEWRRRGYFLRPERLNDGPKPR